MSPSEAKLDGSYQNSVEAGLPPQMSSLGHSVSFHGDKEDAEPFHSWPVPRNSSDNNARP